MYIYKLVDESGTFIGSSKDYPDYSDSWFVKQANKMNNPVTEVLQDNAPDDLADFEVFNECLKHIRESDTYDLLNGRQQRVDPVMEYMGRHYIVVVDCTTKKKAYIKATYNPVEKLYRTFVGKRGRKNLIEDIDSEGNGAFKVDVIETTDNPYKVLLSLFNSYFEKGYSFYNNGTFKDLRAAQRLVSSTDLGGKLG